VGEFLGKTCHFPIFFEERAAKFVLQIKRRRKIYRKNFLSKTNKKIGQEIKGKTIIVYEINLTKKLTKKVE